MSTKIPLTIEGNLTADPEHGTAESGVEYSRFSVAVNDRRLDENTGQWEDAGTVFHRVTAFGRQAGNVADSLRKGDTVLVSGELKFGSYVDKQTGATRESREILADTVGASLKYNAVQVDHAPRVSGPAADATGPYAAPVYETDANLAR
ncbi:single-stranded DNA-binding protein [Microbacterium mangrovi]|uniref:single-stranded DNA-binding protein n=1 Tax=Microbacterium mangrovi TaxID=1348253 RepID=UPI00068F464D|nr:single-stranded DNA-binding protein [Microbacterium mangrovi]